MLFTILKHRFVVSLREDVEYYGESVSGEHPTHFDERIPLKSQHARDALFSEIEVK